DPELRLDIELERGRRDRRAFASDEWDFVLQQYQGYHGLETESDADGASQSDHDSLSPAPHPQVINVGLAETLHDASFPVVKDDTSMPSLTDDDSDDDYSFEYESTMSPSENDFIGDSMNDQPMPPTMDDLSFADKAHAAQFYKHFKH
ncbi:hypothetical protein H0H92_001042, partial [Tricholoma furcatifolium]